MSNAFCPTNIKSVTCATTGIGNRNTYEIKHCLSLIDFPGIRLRLGNPAAGPIFKNDAGKPADMNNLLDRQILRALNRCAQCHKSEDRHKKADHRFERDSSLPQWRGWHGFRRGLATNLHDLGVDDKTVQAILRHSNVAVTQACYIKSLPKQTVDAMKRLEELAVSSNIQ
jgi:integrase